MTSFPFVSVAVFGSAGLVRQSTANNGDHAYFRSRSCQNQRPALRGLGKTIGNPFMMAISPRKSENLAKTRDCGRLGKNRSGTRLSWPSRLFPMVLMPKPATGLGKIEWKTVYHGDSPKKKRRLRQNRPPSTALGKFEWEPVYLGDSVRKPRSDQRNHSDQRNQSDWRSKTGCPLSSKRSTTTDPNFLVRRPKRSKR